ncbi:MAG TPA: ferredoxin [Mycobacterium sp.]
MTDYGRETLTVSANQRKCVAAGNCAFHAPEVFIQDEDTGIVTVTNAQPDEELWATVRLAEELCPVQAINVATSTGYVQRLKDDGREDLIV